MHTWFEFDPPSLGASHAGAAIHDYTVEVALTRPAATQTLKHVSKTKRKNQEYFFYYCRRYRLTLCQGNTFYLTEFVPLAVKVLKSNNYFLWYNIKPNNSNQQAWQTVSEYRRH